MGKRDTQIGRLEALASLAIQQASASSTNGFQPAVTGVPPATQPFLSRPDDAPSINSQITALGTAGGRIRLYNPTIKSPLSLPPRGYGGGNVTLEIVGQMTILVNGGEIDIDGETTIAGYGGGSQEVSGNVSPGASVIGLNYAGAQAADDRLAGLTAAMTGPFYLVDLSGFPANTFNDASNNQSLTITAGGDGSAVGSYVVLAPLSPGNQCRALFRGVGKPTLPQSGLSWSFGSGSGAAATVVGVTTVSRLTGFSAATVSNLNQIYAYKNIVYLTNCSQAALNGNFRCLGGETVTQSGNLALYIVNNIPFNNVYATAATLPEYGVGGVLAAPTIHYQLTQALIRIRSSTVTVSNLTIPAPPGPGILLDGALQVSGQYQLNNLAIGSNTAAGYSFPVFNDGVFEVYYNACAFNNHSGLPSILLTTSCTNLGGAGLQYFYKCQWAGAGSHILMASQSSTSQGSLYFYDNLIESLAQPFILLDPRGGSSNEIIVDNISNNDTNVSTLLDETVPGRFGDLSILRFGPGGSMGESTPLFGSNVRGIRELYIRGEPVASTPFDLGGVGDVLPDYSIDRSNRLDVSLAGAWDAFAPVISQGFDLAMPDVSTWAGLAGSGTITFPAGLRAPDGNTNAAGNLVPMLHSAAGDQSKTVFSIAKTPAVGDYILVGMWMQAQNPAFAAASPGQPSFIGFANPIPIRIDGGASASFNILDGCAYQKGSQWTYVTAIGQVTTSDGNPNALNFVIHTAAGQDMAFYAPWAKYIPASSGIAAKEIIRWYRRSRGHVALTAAGNLGIHPNQKLAWSNRVTLGIDAGNDLVTSSNKLLLGGGVGIRSGAGSPEGAVVGSPGDLFLNTTGGAGTTLYVKESGAATNTGWIGK